MWDYSYNAGINWLCSVGIDTALYVAWCTINSSSTIPLWCIITIGCLNSYTYVIALNEGAACVRRVILL